jgi:hypothetical protein
MVPRPHRCFEDDIKVGEKYPVIVLPMNASSFVDSHFLLQNNKLDVTFLWIRVVKRFSLLKSYF